MTPRVARLRDQSLDARPWLSTERAELVTEATRKTGLLAPALRRAEVFRQLMERKAIHIGDGELMVGERGPSPKATPTFPELCCHTLAALDVLRTRANISFDVPAEARRTYEDRIIPFWEGATLRELIFSEVSEEWRAQGPAQRGE